MKTILVPTDFSKAAQVAVTVAMSVAKRSHAEIVLLHIIETPSDESFNVDGEILPPNWEHKVFTLKMIEKSKEQLIAISAAIEENNVRVRYKVKTGNAYHGISRSITDEKADLVVMGTTGKTKFEEIVIGSNAERVVRNSKCPVLTVHEKSNITDFANIVYATSMSDDEKSFAEVVANSQELFGSTIHLVRINTPLNFKPDTVVKPIMETFARRNHLSNYTLNVFNDMTEEEGIIHFANAIKADLIAMATHGRKGLAHVIAGSIAEEVAVHANQPVLTYVTSLKK